MSKKIYIKPSVYNSGDELLTSRNILDKELFILENTSYNLRDTLKGLDSIEKFGDSYNLYYNDISRKIDDWRDLLSKQIEKDLTFIPHHGIYYSTVFSALEDPLKGKYSNVLPSKSRIASINEQLRSLKIRLKAKYSKDLLRKIRSLVLELHSLFSLQLKWKRKSRRRNHVLIHYHITRDIRNFIRNLVKTIIKFLCDCTDSEEGGELFMNFKCKQFLKPLELSYKCSTQRKFSIRSMNI